MYPIYSFVFNLFFIQCFVNVKEYEGSWAWSYSFILLSHEFPGETGDDHDYSVVKLDIHTVTVTVDESAYCV
jgi:hypothetical protein